MRLEGTPLSKKRQFRPTISCTSSGLALRPAPEVQRGGRRVASELREARATGNEGAVRLGPQSSEDEFGAPKEFLKGCYVVRAACDISIGIHRVGSARRVLPVRAVRHLENPTSATCVKHPEHKTIVCRPDAFCFRSAPRVVTHAVSLKHRDVWSHSP